MVHWLEVAISLELPSAVGILVSDFLDARASFLLSDCVAATAQESPASLAENAKTC
jgi:hypothetical protein